MSLDVNQSVKKLMLAPMEGVLDYSVRNLLTELNPFDYCVTEFIRITHHIPPKKTFLRYCPELNHGGKTHSGTPVRIQLLGQDPQRMAESAYEAVSLGSYGIDINCGCPAKTVVGHQGGAYLLTQPELIHQIAYEVKKLIGDACLSVKIRLGWDNKDRALEIAQAIEEAGANEIIVHGRTKVDGYQADKIDWQTIGMISQQLTIPVIANGQVTSKESAQRCADLAKTHSIMIGRGILAYPNLAQHILEGAPLLDWDSILSLLLKYAETSDYSDVNTEKPLYYSARIKQWLSYLREGYPEAKETLFAIRQSKTRQEIIKGLKIFTSN